METINNAAQVASKYIFGDDSDKTGTDKTGTDKTGSEPISGETGKGTVNEPYDAGNKEGETKNDTGISSEPKNETGTSSETKNDSGSSSAEVKAPEQTQPSAVSNPENPADSSGPQPDKKPGTDDKPPSDEDDEQTRGEKALKNKDPDDHSGEPLQMHGEPEKKEGEEGEEVKEGKEGESKGDGDKKDDKDEGTGEKWVKTSGLAADGGDFDATKPGAGREADRIMEQKGIHKTEPGKPAPPEPSPSGKEKTSMSQKIKDKLHIGSGKHS